MVITCTQCGGAVEVPPGTPFLTCGFCGSALYLDKSGVVFHYVVSPTINFDEAQGKLKRWMAGNETVKDLDRLATMGNHELTYFPMWRFVVSEADGDREFSQPACSTPIADLRSLPLSGGSLKFFSPGEFAGMPLREPDILFESACQWLVREGATREAIKETNLIHIPFYRFEYTFSGKPYQAVVEGTTGRVLTSIFPAKAELPFIGVSILCALIFFILGLITPNIFIRLIVYIAAAIPLGLLCLAIVRKY
jgi:hypothetical protein